jgi:hypothetical protein
MPRSSLSIPAARTPRAHLVAALEADLIGAFSPDRATATELLRLAPSRWYLTGFLANELVREADEDTQDGDLGAGDDDEPDQQGDAEREPKAKRFLPASAGLTVLLRPGTTTVDVRLRYADYVLMNRKELAAIGENPPSRPRETSRTTWWKRMPRDWTALTLDLDPGGETNKEVPDSRGVELVTRSEIIQGVDGIDDGTLAVSVFVVNRRAADPDKVRDPRRDEKYIFQVELAVVPREALVPRADRHLEGSDDLDDRILDLQYRSHVEWAVGHGCSTETMKEGDAVIGVRTVWIPQAEVVKVEPRDLKNVELRMEQLAALGDAAAVHAALDALPREYATWIATQAKVEIAGERRREIHKALVTRAEEARRRIEAGIALLAADPQARHAFTLANAAMAHSQRKRRPDREPKWRPFQLAFVLLNLSGIVDPTHTDREIVELIFFPTGGGKTEAYLGVIAFTLLLRRMRGQTRPDAGLGVAVILRYTLRLLTLDQLGRAAGLVCALELKRRAQPELLGKDRFAIGLWVGRSASANTLTEAKQQVEAYRNGMREGTPFPLTQCPWCGHDLDKQSLTTRTSGTRTVDIVATCPNRKGGCEFSGASQVRDGLPVLFVDEQIYRQLPAFIVGTVDKFAMLPWRGETGMLFGKVHSRQGARFFGPVDDKVAGAGSEALPGGLRPPELIVQDELHLISGPLGTMVGLYETMVEQLCIDGSSGAPVRPKIIAATATVRRAHAQIRALFARTRASVFPPAGVDAWDTFFAEIKQDASKRLYIGVAAAGRPIKRILIHTYRALLAAAEKVYDRKSTDDAISAGDPYMTLVGYFNSLRELGGMRRLVEDEIHGSVRELAKHHPEDWVGPHPWFANRRISNEPIELTSRESTPAIAEHKESLRRHFHKEAPIDVCLASNMISVGVDIDRLGLMVIAGQPKTTSEYIQASSRVGRQEHWPGLVVTVFNLHKPRDRSHYEHFASYHESFYRNVESQSLTPFSGPAVDRGFAGTIVGMTRLGEVAMTHPKAVVELRRYRKVAESFVRALAERARRHTAEEGTDQLAKDLYDRGLALLDSWDHILKEAAAGAGTRFYSRFDELKEGTKPLLHMIGDTANVTDEHERKFHAPTSMRDVEASVHIWVDRGALGTGGR